MTNIDKARTRQDKQTKNLRILAAIACEFEMRVLSHEKVHLLLEIVRYHDRHRTLFVFEDKCKARQGRARQSKARQGKTQDKTRHKTRHKTQDKKRQDKTRQNKTRQDQPQHKARLATTRHKKDHVYVRDTARHDTTKIRRPFWSNGRKEIRSAWSRHTPDARPLAPPFALVWQRYRAQECRPPNPTKTLAPPCTRNRNSPG
jgi:hypothetical protein